MSFFNTKEIAFGLDISDRSLRLIQLNRRGKKIKVQNYNEIKLPTDCLCQGEIKQPKIFLDYLNKLIKTRRGRGKLSDEVIGVLPEEKTFLKVIDLPNCDNGEISNQIKEIIPQHLPLEIEEVYLDWQIINENQGKKTVLVGASPKKIVDSYVEILSQANLIPTVLEVEAAAISRAILTENNDEPPKIIIDIGANRTGLFLYERQAVKFTVSLPISGNQITKLIMETLDLDFAKAEQAKVICGLDEKKCDGALLEIFAESIKELKNQINQTINFYENNFDQPQKISEVILTGGGANFLNIAQVLQKELELTTKTCQPWAKIINPNPKFFTPEKSQSFVTALGLALRGLESKTFL